jgi:hypothetical protein
MLRRLRLLGSCSTKCRAPFHWLCCLLRLRLLTYFIFNFRITLVAVLLAVTFIALYLFLLPLISRSRIGHFFAFDESETVPRFLLPLGSL